MVMVTSKGLATNAAPGFKQLQIPLIDKEMVIQKIARLLEIHPPLRMICTAGWFLMSASAMDTEVKLLPGQSLKDRVKAKLYDEPLFRWGLRSDGVTLEFAIQHFNSDAESLEIILSDLKELFQGQELPARPYHLIGRVRELLKSSEAAVPSLSPYTKADGVCLCR